MATTNSTCKDRQLIKGMFSEIAGTYNRANSILSLGLHHWWKHNLVKRATIKAKSGKVLDVCSGTGDILSGLRKFNVDAYGIDFALPMLQLQKKDLQNGSRIAQADALLMPFQTATFDVVTVSYGVRNFESLQAGLKEILRVLKPDGTLLILEFGEKPKGIIGSIIKIYENLVLPTLGGIISGKSRAYRYLAQTSNEFPGGDNLISACKDAGFKDGAFDVLCFGATYLYELKS